MRDKAFRIQREQAVPVVKLQRGLTHLYLLPDRADKVILISLWNSKAHALAIEAVSAYQRQVSKLDSLLAKPPLDPILADTTGQVRALDQVHSQFGLN